MCVCCFRYFDSKNLYNSASNSIWMLIIVRFKILRSFSARLFPMDDYILLCFVSWSVRHVSEEPSMKKLFSLFSNYGNEICIVSKTIYCPFKTILSLFVGEKFSYITIFSLKTNGFSKWAISPLSLETTGSKHVKVTYFVSKNI